MKSKFPLTIKALGEPGEVLLVKGDPLENRKELGFEMKEIIHEDRAMDHLQMVDTINAERREISPKLVSKNLEEIKTAWLDSASEIPTSSELKDLARTLFNGFTMKQLGGFLKSGNSPIDQLDLYLPYSSSHYKRSSWSFGITPFPGHGSAPQITLSTELDAVIEQPRGATGGHKNELIEKILVQQWRLLSREALNSSGELNIWISRQQLDLLLNYSKDTATV